MVILIVVIAIAIIMVLMVTRSSQKDDIQRQEREERELKRQQQKKEREDNFIKALGDLENSYGKLSIEIPLIGGKGDGYYAHSLSTHLYFYEDSNMAIIEGEHIAFDKILSCCLTDNQQTISITSGKNDTRTSTSSAIGRALVGGVLMGGVGALAGATTAKKETNINTTTKHTTTHDFVIYLNVDDITNPQRILKFGADAKSANTAASVFNLIISRNSNK